MVTLYDVAKKANVSPSTAARALRNKGCVSESARKAVRRAAKQLGYLPNVAARDLRLKCGHTIGILCRDVSYAAAGLMMRGVFDACHKEGYRLTFGNSYDEPEKGILLLHTFRQNKVAGIIVMVPMRKESSLNAALVEAAWGSIPLVLLERAPEGVGADEVIVGDWVSASRIATQHLLSLGHEKIAMIAGTEGVLTGDDRIAGYREALGHHGLSAADEYLVRCDFHGLPEVRAGRAMRDLLVLSDPLTAVFAATEMMALGAIDACRRSGVTVPDGTSIVGVGIDSGYTRLFRPQLTLVAMPYYEAGHAAGTQLMARIRGDRGPRRTIILESKLLVRESTAPPKRGSLTTKSAQVLSRC